MHFQSARMLQNASEGSDDFNLCLLEMLVAILRNLAIKECHPTADPHEENMSPDDLTALEHRHYNNCPDYPNDLGRNGRLIR